MRIEDSDDESDEDAPFKIRKMREILMDVHFFPNKNILDQSSKTSLPLGA